MIDRTIKNVVIETIKNKPVTLITGARQVGKTTLCKIIMEDMNFNYVSLDDLRERSLAITDPEMFLKLHNWPLIIDEIQYAPGLFDVIEALVNKQKFDTGNNYGMFVLTGSQSYNLMQGVSQSMAGRIGIVKMSPLSYSEISGVEENPFSIDLQTIQKRTKKHKLDVNDLYKNIVRGFYPELYDNKKLDYNSFYADYVNSYIEKDVSQLINLNDKLKFQKFIELLASMTGEELIYSNLSKIIGININTVKSWISVLVAGDIITLIEPYYEDSITKRITKRQKIVFNDTGLACYLARLNDSETLRRSRFAGHFVETYIINEIIKSYHNNNQIFNAFYYRDSNLNEIDLIILQNGILTPIECKSGVSYNSSDVSGFKQIDFSKYDIGTGAVICNTDSIYVIKEKVYAIPITAI